MERNNPKSYHTQWPATWNTKCHNIKSKYHSRRLHHCHKATKLASLYGTFSGITVQTQIIIMQIISKHCSDDTIHNRISNICTAPKSNKINGRFHNLDHYDAVPAAASDAPASFLDPGTSSGQAVAPVGTTVSAVTPASPAVPVVLSHSITQSACKE